MRAIGEQGLMIAAIVGALAKAGIVLSPAARIVEAILTQSQLARLHLDPRANDRFVDWSDADRWLETDTVIEIHDGALLFTGFAHVEDATSPEIWQRNPLGRLQETADGSVHLVAYDKDWESPAWRNSRYSLVTVSVNASMAIRRALRTIRDITPPE